MPSKNKNDPLTPSYNTRQKGQKSLDKALEKEGTSLPKKKKTDQIWILYLLVIMCSSVLDQHEKKNCKR